MDIEFIQEYIPMYVEAAKLTLGIAVVGIIISVVVGLICANIQYYKVPVLKRIVSIYIELSNTPYHYGYFYYTLACNERQAVDFLASYMKKSHCGSWILRLDLKRQLHG